MIPAATDPHAQPADALVVFGATGDLAYKKIFPALYAMCQRGALKMPVIGVASSTWEVAQLRTRVRESIEQMDGEVDCAALQCLLSALQHVSGDYAEACTGAQPVGIS